MSCDALLAIGAKIDKSGECVAFLFQPTSPDEA